MTTELTEAELLTFMATGWSEKEFQARVIAEAELNGWLVYHTYDSRRSQKGFPDLVLVRDQETIFAELKSESGLLRGDQCKWRDALINAQQVWRLWRPSDINEILRILKAAA